MAKRKTRRLGSIHETRAERDARMPKQQYNRNGMQMGKADATAALRNIGTLIREMTATGDRSKCARLQSEIEFVSPWTAVGPQSLMKDHLEHLCGVSLPLNPVQSPLFEQEEGEDPIDASWRAMRARGMMGLSGLNGGLRTLFSPFQRFDQQARAFYTELKGAGDCEAAFDALTDAAYHTGRAVEQEQAASSMSEQDNLDTTSSVELEDELESMLGIYRARCVRR